MNEECVLEIERTKSDKMTFPELVVAMAYNSIVLETGGGDQKVFGAYDLDEKKVYVSGDLPFPNFLYVLFHELAHWGQDMANAPMNEDEADDFANKLYQAIEWKLPDELKKEE